MKRPILRRTARTPASPALDQGQVVWLALAALGALLPLTPELPLWLGPLCAVAILWRGWLQWRRVPLPPGWLVTLAALAGALGIAAEFRTLLGQYSGVALLCLFLALKLFETRRRRDAFVVALLCLFLILARGFYDQSMLSALLMGGGVFLVTAGLAALQPRPAEPLPAGIILGQSARLLLQALPFMVLLFLLFPRVSGPLWGLPRDAGSALSGLGDTMSPGAISRLTLSDAIAFRVRFQDGLPPRRQLYWRGPVLTDFDGLTWRGRPERTTRRPFETAGPGHAYETTLEAHGRAWLLALDYPGEAPPGTRFGAGNQLLADQPLMQRQRYALTAYPESRPGIDEIPGRLRQALQLPPTGNPRSRALAERLRREQPDDAARIAALLNLIRTGGFVYTLEPPPLAGDTVDGFLFGSRRGFCEHYAGAFAFVLRAAGIPARVVTGYQGGEINPVDGYLLVRQSDAHAWVEAWLPGEGWRRIDPTAAVAPGRVEDNLAAALPAGDPRPLLARPGLDWLRQLRYRWEAVNNAWNQWVLGYDSHRQRDLLQRLGIDSADGQSLLLAGAIAATLALATALALGARQGNRPDPLARSWQRFSARIARLDPALARHAWEGPRDWQCRLVAALPAQTGEILGICALYEALRYGRVDADHEHRLRQLNDAITAFPSSPPP